jgi:hypothetical protein
MAPKSTQKEASEEQVSRERTEPKADPLGQSPEDPIEFAADNEVARGNEERANAEPEPQALHAAQVPGVPDQAAKRREKEMAEEDETSEPETARK